MSGTFACPVCGRDTPHQHTDDEIQAARLMAMPEAEVDAELRRLGIDPDEAARQGKAAVEGALEAIRARNAGVAPTVEAQRIAELEAEVADVRRWYGDRLEILSAWARVSLKDEPLQTFFNIAANARPHHTDEPEWFRAVIAKLAAERRNAGVLVVDHQTKQQQEDRP